MTAPPRVNLPQSLKREWAGWAVGSAALVLLAGVTLTMRLGASDAVKWTAPALVVSVYASFFARRRLVSNHPGSSATLFTTLGSGNRLTLVRGVLIAFLAGFVILPGPVSGLAWAPMILYTLSDVCDYFDGYLARRTHHSTLLGEELDIEFDALGLMLAVFVGIRLGALPVWYLIIGLSRYAFLFGNRIVRSRGRLIAPLPPSASRRPIAGLTMGFTSAALWPILPTAVTHIASYVFAVPISISFIRDWLVVSGMIHPEASLYVRLRAAAKRVFLSWLPLPLRLGVFISGAAIVASQLHPAMGLAEGLSVAVETIALLSIALGLVGRLGAFVLLFPIGLSFVEKDLTPSTAFLLVTTLLILILGTGALSLAKPEERFLARRAGESE